jgi:methylated-DNA-[protein]-cysteine S-methyltransferase
MTLQITFDRVPTPLGTMLAVAAGDALRGLYFEGRKHEPTPGPDWRQGRDVPVLRAAREQLAEYFAGVRTRFDLPLAPVGTSFQQAVWTALGAIPSGTTSTYRELATRIGRPGSARAVGAAVGRNPLSIVIPCHRVVGSDGSLTGYAGGLERKRALLTLEAAGESGSVLGVAA